MTEPLVTVAIPTFNRPEGLRRTLRSIAAQTWKNIEIIVSDNASTDPSVRAVICDAVATDTRIRAKRHHSNIGAIANFGSLLEEGVGEFFMWAADDDRWEPVFIERCMRALLRNPKLALCQMEAQYELARGGGLYPFFCEGAAFYEVAADGPEARVEYLLRHTYGNLVYGVFRRGALFHRGKPVTNWIGATLNEIPMLVLVAANGSVQVLPEVGMYKRAQASVCAQAEWEQGGGWLPGWPGLRAHFAALGSIHRYHRMVAHETSSSISDLDLGSAAASRLRSVSRAVLGRHALSLSLRWKPAAREAKPTATLQPTARREEQ